MTPDPQLVVDVVRAARDETPYVRSLPLHMAAHHAFPHAEALAARIEQLEAENLTLRSSLAWCAGHFQGRDGEVPAHVAAALREGER